MLLYIRYFLLWLVDSLEVCEFLLVSLELKKRKPVLLINRDSAIQKAGSCFNVFNSDFFFHLVISEKKLAVLKQLSRWGFTDTLRSKLGKSGQLGGGVSSETH